MHIGPHVMAAHSSLIPPPHSSLTTTTSITCPSPLISSNIDFPLHCTTSCTYLAPTPRPSIRLMYRSPPPLLRVTPTHAPTHIASYIPTLIQPLKLVQFFKSISRLTMARLILLVDLFCPLSPLHLPLHLPLHPLSTPYLVETYIRVRIFYHCWPTLINLQTYAIVYLTFLTGDLDKGGNTRSPDRY